jgi:hypothetical protein
LATDVLKINIENPCNFKILSKVNWKSNLGSFSLMLPGTLLGFTQHNDVTPTDDVPMPQLALLPWTLAVRMLLHPHRARGLGAVAAGTLSSWLCAQTSVAVERMQHVSRRQMPVELMLPTRRQERQLQNQMQKT